MDATQWGSRRSALVFLLGAAIFVGCTQPQTGSVNANTLNGQFCASQAMDTSFLVKWKTRVPGEYQKYQLHSKSLVTRFSHMTKTQVEKTILQKHLGDYAVAEYEFKTENIATEMNTTPASGTGAWGPADIQASDAWGFLGKKGEGVIVAVVDSGVDINHPLLQGNIWVNPNEIPGNGIDDDHDGFVDDVTGWDFNGNSANVADLANHGTHVSGIIAGQAGVNGFTGVAPGAKILPVKFIDGTGSGSVGDAISGMDYAVSKGAKVINASWGGSQCSDILKQDIVQAAAAGTVFVSAAGNGVQGVGVDINDPRYPEWPAAFQIPGKITVASYNSAQFLSSFSNFGILVDLAAPGESILSTVPPANGAGEGPNLGIKSGTSMATPFVTGVVALLFSAKPTATPQQITEAINFGVTSGSNFGVRTHGKLNALKAAQYLMSH